MPGTMPRRLPMPTSSCTSCPHVWLMAFVALILLLLAAASALCSDLWCTIWCLVLVLAPLSPQDATDAQCGAIIAFPFSRLA
mgnify:CR=1 FL=1